MTSTGQIIRWSTAGAMAGVAAVAAVASCEHACTLVRAHGETGWTGRLVPLTVDGLVAAWPAIALAGSYELVMTIIHGARQPGDRVPGAERVPGAVSGADPLRVQAAGVFRVVPEQVVMGWLTVSAVVLSVRDRRACARNDPLPWRGR